MPRPAGLDYMQAGAKKLLMYIYSRFYKNVPKSDFDTVHLYEHLLVNRIITNVARANGTAYGFGEVSGETFDNSSLCVFLHLYNKQLHRIAVGTIGSLVTQPFTLKELDKSIEQVEAEDISSISYGKRKLSSELEYINSIAWNQDTVRNNMLPENFNKQDSTQIIKFEKTPRAFSRVSFRFHVEVDEHQKSSFLFFVIVLQDLLREIIASHEISQQQAYFVDDSTIKEIDGKFEFGFISRTRQVNANRYTRDYLAYIQDFLQPESYKFIKEVFNGYISNPFYISSFEERAKNLGFGREVRGITKKELTLKNYREFLSRIEFDIKS